MKHGLRWAALAVGVVVIVFAVVLALNVGSDPQKDALESQLLGKQAPAFTLTTLDGQPFTEADIAGKSVLVNFWNSWCIPCQEELPALKKFYAAHANDSDFVMLGIVRRDDKKTISEFVSGEGIGWKVAFDPSKQAALDFGTRGQPETFAISPSGQIVAYQPGPMTLPQLDAFLSHARQAG